MRNASGGDPGRNGSAERRGSTGRRGSAGPAGPAWSSAGWPAGALAMSAGGWPADRRSGAFLVELERLVVRLLGQLEPDEEARQDEERDDDQRAEGDAKRNGDCLESLHEVVLLCRSGGRRLAGARRTGRGGRRNPQLRGALDHLLDVLPGELGEDVVASLLVRHEQPDDERPGLLEEEDVPWLLLVHVPAEDAERGLIVARLLPVGRRRWRDRRSLRPATGDPLVH